MSYSALWRIWPEIFSRNITATAVSYIQKEVFNSEDLSLSVKYLDDECSSKPGIIAVVKELDKIDRWGYILGLLFGNDIQNISDIFNMFGPVWHIAELWAAIFVTKYIGRDLDLERCIVCGSISYCIVSFNFMGFISKSSWISD